MTSPVTFTLLFANVAISIWAFYSNPIYFERFSEWPYQIIHQKRYYQVLTSAFLHANFMHLFFNMFALFSFGTFLETVFVNSYGEIYGSLYFFIIYFVSLFTGSLLTVAFNYKNPGYVAVGASGAVSGVVFAYVILFPMNTIGVFFVPMPAFIFAFLYIGASIYGMKSKFGNIGHEAHLGGALGGILATIILIDGAIKIFLSNFGIQF
ncbi:MAG: rhomboid family intramembrane serine protease [Ignavibacteria bacterium]|jgi:membrane associated rhomboid family serine protease|nr:rhomboid family intramembrane serine protease [Ignavibacteria bacterium]